MGSRRPPAVARVLTRVTATVREHGFFAPGDTVLVSVSGGPDSVCLLYALWHLRRLLRIRLEAFTFDHRLRDDSATDVAYVRRVCSRLRVPCHPRVATDAPARGASVEAWATTARMQAAHDVRREIGAATVAEAHTLDDQAETVLLNLVRGSGLDGLAGIWPGERGAALVQPLLAVTREEVESFCRALHLRPRRDPMNEDRRYLRTAIRLDVLPALEAATGRGVAATIARTADNLRADRRELVEATVRAADGVVERTPGGELRFDAAGLRALSPPLAARVVRWGVFNLLATDEAPWSKPATDAILDLAEGRPGRRRDLADGRVARRDRTQVVVERGLESRG
ncbi:MAG TPA: tRNA lysidine(34) synthetase TilS [Actinomycetota bacterium]